MKRCYRCTGEERPNRAIGPVPITAEDTADLCEVCTRLALEHPLGQERAEYVNTVPRKVNLAGTLKKRR